MTILEEMKAIQNYNEEFYYSGLLDNLEYSDKLKFYWSNVIAMNCELEKLENKLNDLMK